MILFILRNWQAAVGLAAAALLAALLAIRTGERDDARIAYEREQRAAILFAERVRARSEEISRRFTENARRTERAQNRITEEVSRDYQTRISELGRRVAALRLRPDAAGGANSGGAGRAAMPGLSGPAGRADGTAPDPGLSLDERIAATEQAIRLEALQRWVRRQMDVEPQPESGGSGDPSR